MEIKILGSGCPKCRTLEANTRKAVQELNISADITKITNINEITEYGIMMTPALVVDEKVISSGKVLGTEQIKALIGNKA